VSVPRHVELHLHGFDADPATLVAPHPELRLHAFRKGESMRGGRVRPTNWLIVERNFGYQTGWDEALASLVGCLGGEADLARLLQRSGAERRHVGFDLPIQSSPLQEGNMLSLRSLELLCRLGLDLQFGFWEFDPGDPTHRDPEDGLDPLGAP
jgi:hypothetical protein